MSEYELARNALRVIPFILIIFLSIILSKKPWFLRYAVVFILGWIAIIIFTQLFWDFSIKYAPTDEIRIDLSRRDSGPRVGALFLGWIYVAFLMVIFELIMFITRLVKKRFYKKRL